jgi:hypothetical protein
VSNLSDGVLERVREGKGGGVEGAGGIWGGERVVSLSLSDSTSQRRFLVRLLVAGSQKGVEGLLVVGSDMN